MPESIDSNFEQDGRVLDASSKVKRFRRQKAVYMVRKFTEASAMLAGTTFVGYAVGAEAGSIVGAGLGTVDSILTEMTRASDLGGTIGGILGLALGVLLSARQAEKAGEQAYERFDKKINELNR